MGCVYLLGDWEKENFFKIGVTRGDINKRIKKLQTGNGGEMFLVYKYETEHPFLMENMLHLWYKDKNILNEWFELSNEDIKQFKEDCKKADEIIMSMESNYFFQKKLKKQ